MSDTATIEKPTRGLLSVPDAARRLGINAKTLRKALASGEVRSVKLCCAVRIPLAEVERLLAAKTGA